MRFKVNRVALVKEIGGLGVDAFLTEFSRFCSDNLATQNASKFDVSLLRALCNILENSYEAKHPAESKLDKKSVVINEYVRIKGKLGLTYDVADRDVLSALIEDLHNSKSIRKVPWMKLWGRRLRTFLLGSK